MQLSELDSAKIISLYKECPSSKKRIIFLDYDGTLTATHQLPDFAKPNANIISTLTKLNADPNTYVYILSGRGRSHLEKWFDQTGVGLSAEHGCFFRHPVKADGVKHEWQLLVVDSLDAGWRDTIRPLFQHYMERTPGSFIEEKEVSRWLIETILLNDILLKRSI